jgi:hypothetical protein
LWALPEDTMGVAPSDGRLDSERKPVARQSINRPLKTNWHHTRMAFLPECGTISSRPLNFVKHNLRQHNLRLQVRAAP